MKNKLDDRLKRSIKIILALFKSAVSSYTQVLWMLLAIILIRKQDTSILNIPNVSVLNDSLQIAANWWNWLIIIIGLYYLYFNLKEIKPNKIKDGSH